MPDLVPLKDIFDIEYGNQLDRNKLSADPNGVNFICRSSADLGVDDKVSRIEETEPYEKGLITVTLGGTYLLSSFVQPEPFYTAQNIKVLTPKKEMEFREKVFYCYAISKNRFRYTSHGREANKTLDDLLVPSRESVPDWIESAEAPDINKSPVLSDSELNFDTTQWKYFAIKCLFDIKGTKTTAFRYLEPTPIQEGFRYVGTQAKENGVRGFYNQWTEEAVEGGIFTIDSAVSGYCTYQNQRFAASDHVEKMTPKFAMNKYIAMFLMTVINNEQFRYNYGRKCSQTRLKKARIKLPVDTDGNPDWQFMEDYIKSLPYSSNL